MNIDNKYCINVCLKNLHALSNHLLCLLEQELESLSCEDQLDYSSCDDSFSRQFIQEKAYEDKTSTTEFDYRSLQQLMNCIRAFCQRKNRNDLQYQNMENYDENCPSHYNVMKYFKPNSVDHHKDALSPEDFNVIRDIVDCFKDVCNGTANKSFAVDADKEYDIPELKSPFNDSDCLRKLVEDIEGICGRQHVLNEDKNLDSHQPVMFLDDRSIFQKKSEYVERFRKQQIASSKKQGLVENVQPIFEVTDCEDLKKIVNYINTLCNQHKPNSSPEIVRLSLPSEVFPNLPKSSTIYSHHLSQTLEPKSSTVKQNVTDVSPLLPKYSNKEKTKHMEIQKSFKSSHTLDEVPNLYDIKSSGLSNKSLKQINEDIQENSDAKDLENAEIPNLAKKNLSVKTIKTSPPRFDSETTSNDSILLTDLTSDQSFKGSKSKKSSSRKGVTENMNEFSETVDVVNSPELLPKIKSITTITQKRKKSKTLPAKTSSKSLQHSDEKPPVDLDANLQRSSRNLSVSKNIDKRNGRNSMSSRPRQSGTHHQKSSKKLDPFEKEIMQQKHQRDGGENNWDGWSRPSIRQSVHYRQSDNQHGSGPVTESTTNLMSPKGHITDNDLLNQTSELLMHTRKSLLGGTASTFPSTILQPSHHSVQLSTKVLSNSMKRTSSINENEFSIENNSNQQQDNTNQSNILPIPSFRAYSSSLNVNMDDLFEKCYRTISTINSIIDNTY